MNFLNIFEDHVAGIFGATRAPFSFKKLAKQAARDMEDQTLVINGVNTAPALYTILIAADDDPMLAPFYPELSREVREFVKARPKSAAMCLSASPSCALCRPQLRAASLVFAENRRCPHCSAACTKKSAPTKRLGPEQPPAAKPCRQRPARRPAAVCRPAAAAPRRHAPAAADASRRRSRPACRGRPLRA